MSTDALIRPVTDAIHQILRPRGYRKKGLTFWRDVGGVRQFVNIQRSTSSTKEAVVFTLNLAVLCPKALASWESDSSIESAPWRDRIGSYGPSGSDLWWTVTSEEDARAAVEAVMPLLESGLLALEAVDSVSALIEALRTEGAPILLPPLRKEKYIEKLEALQ